MFSYHYLSKSPLGVSSNELDHIKPPDSGHQLARATQCSIQVNTVTSLFEAWPARNVRGNLLTLPDIGLLYGPFYSRRGHASICVPNIARPPRSCNVGRTVSVCRGFAACKAERFAYILPKGSDAGVSDRLTGKSKSRLDWCEPIQPASSPKKDRNDLL